MTAPVRNQARNHVEPGWDEVDGVLVEKDMGAASDFVASKVSGRLLVATEQAESGAVFGQGAGYQYPGLDGGKLRFPDVSFIAAGRLPEEIVPDAWIPIPPDLAVEVASPNDEAEELQAKVRTWLAGGAKEVWAIFLLAREVMAYYADGTVRRFTEDDTLTTDLIPGLAIEVAGLFPKRAPTSSP